jgi:anaerobic selenocysteine-containing dehydrogenase
MTSSPASSAAPRTGKTACILCSRNCGLEVTVEHQGGADRITQIRGDKAHPMTQGYLCQKAARLDRYQHHEGRLRHPLRREADGSFVRVSWDEALGDIAQRLLAIRAAHGGDAFALVGGGGQGNHLGGTYAQQMLPAMGSRFVYSALAQEKTGDFWLNGRMFGRQTCHTTEDVEHADYVLFIGCNPYQSHGIPNARDTLKALAKTPGRTMVVIDPRRTETAKQAHVHLQLRPGTDAFLLSAMLAIIVREGLHDRDFIAAHCDGFDEVEAALKAVDVDDCVRRADVALADVERVARGFATAGRACVRIDLGLQHTLHCTLNGWLEKLLYLVTGNFGRQGGNNLHTSMMPLIGHTDERESRAGRPLKRTAVHGMHPIAGLYPPNLLPDEILQGGEQRLRALIVDSCNPALTYADTAKQREALASLELLVVVDVALTETARLAHYVLPAASQFEKVEATAFTLEFPVNFFHLRHPLFEPLDESLPEPEIYTRLLEKMGRLPARFPVLSGLARAEPHATSHVLYAAALTATLARDKALRPYGASVLYRTLGPTLPKGLEGAAVMLPLAIHYATVYREAVRRAGHRGNRLTLGAALFRAIVAGRSGVVTSRHEHDEVWSLVKTPDRRIRLAVPEMFEELRALAHEGDAAADPAHPFVLMAGERRAYNANQIFRDPAWRKGGHDGAMRMHPDDAAALGLADGAHATCRSARAAIEVVIEIDDGVRRGVVTLPHGYGQRGEDGRVDGPAVNLLTSTDQCDAVSKTPRHKYVPVRVEAMVAPVRPPQAATTPA